jgi:hypothetical protein
MKKLLLYGTLLILTAFASCSEEGSEPQAPTDERDKFLGAWLCTEKLTGQSPTTFTIDISKIGTDSVKIKNFSNYNDLTFAYGEVSGNSLTIPQQNIGVTSIPVQGSGVYSSNAGGKITMTYVQNGTNATANCVRP